MRRLLLLAAVVFGLVASACQPNPVPPAALARWEERLSVVVPQPDAPALVHALLNEAIRTGIPIVCPMHRGPGRAGLPGVHHRIVQRHRAEQRPLHVADQGAPRALQG